MECISSDTESNCFKRNFHCHRYCRYCLGHKIRRPPKSRECMDSLMSFLVKGSAQILDIPIIPSSRIWNVIGPWFVDDLFEKQNECFRSGPATRHQRAPPIGSPGSRHSWEMGTLKKNQISNLRFSDTKCSIVHLPLTASRKHCPEGPCSPEVLLWSELIQQSPPVAQNCPNVQDCGGKSDDCATVSGDGMSCFDGWMVGKWYHGRG